MSEAREEAERRWPKGWDVEEGTWRDGAVNGFVLGAEWADQGKPQPTDDELIETYHEANHRAMEVANQRDGFGSSGSRESIVAGLRAVLQAARVVADQGKRQITEQMVEDGARALAYRLADLDWPGTTVVSAPIRFEHRSGARAVLEAALGKGGE